jgi:hypothetical protein
MTLGNTFQMVHLFIVISRPAADGSVVIISFTSWKFGCDESCIIEDGEHPFVHGRTVLSYPHAKSITLAEQAYILANPTLAVPHRPVSPELLARIQNAVVTSRLVAGKLRAAVRASIP